MTVDPTPAPAPAPAPSLPPGGYADAVPLDVSFLVSVTLIVAVLMLAWIVVRRLSNAISKNSPPAIQRSETQIRRAGRPKHPASTGPALTYSTPKGVCND